MAIKYFYPRLSLPQQRAKMFSMWPTFKVVDSSPSKVRWAGTIAPSAMSADYRLSVSYQVGGIPRVRVMTPNLLAPVGKVIPHLYKEGTLCLYYPKANQWKPSHFIADTIIPWSSLWLFHYEIWLASGTWMGGGISHHKGELRENV